jgi:hypothetical protein
MSEKNILSGVLSDVWGCAQGIHFQALGGLAHYCTAVNKGCSNPPFFARRVFRSFDECLSIEVFRLRAGAGALYFVKETYAA